MLSEHFARTEFQCKHCGEIGDGISPVLLRKLEALREAVKRPIIVNSGYRCPTYNKRVGGAPASYHMKGMAADIYIKGLKPATVAATADQLGFGGVIIYDTFVHVDVRQGRYRSDRRTKDAKK